MTVPSGGGSRPIGADPTATFPSAGGPVSGGPLPVSPAAPPRDVRPPHAPPLVPVATPPAAAVPVPPRDRDSRDGTERRRRKAPLAWLPWALLAALLTLLALMLLAGTLAGAERAVERAADRAGTATEGSGAGGPGPEAAGAGTLRVGETDLLSSPEALGRLASVQGQQAVGRGLRVQAVVADEGFWAGSSAAQRFFVYLTPEARASSGESAFQVREGQTVDVNGRIIGTSPGDPELFGVTDAEGARQLTSQRAYLRATQVRLSP